MTEKIFCLKPNYLDEFKCDGAKCGALCCRNAWSIFIDDETYAKYSTLPTTEILRHLQFDSTCGKYFIVPEKNSCPLLDADNLCRVQKTFGEDFLSQVCASYPRIITRLENYLELALSPTCPVAAELIFRKEPLRFEVVEASEKILRLGTNHIVQGLPQEVVPLIVDVQLTMASILQTRTLTIDQRLIATGFFLDRIEELNLSDKLDCAAVKRLSAIYSSEKFLSEQVPLMSKIIRFDATEHENFLREIFSVIEENFPDVSDNRRLSAELVPLAENFLVNEIFLNAYPLRIDSSLVNNFGVFAAVYKIFERKTFASDVMTAADNLSQKIDHSEDYLPKISALFGDRDVVEILGLLIPNS